MTNPFKNRSFGSFTLDIPGVSSPKVTVPAAPSVQPLQPTRSGARSSLNRKAKGEHFNIS